MYKRLIVVLVLVYSVIPFSADAGFLLPREIYGNAAETAFLPDKIMDLQKEKAWQHTAQYRERSPRTSMPQMTPQPDTQIQSTPDQPQQIQPPQLPAQQEEQQPAVQTQPQTAVPQQPASMTVAKKGEVSFNFDDADIFSVIQTVFGDVLKVNYIIDPGVKGRVNFRSVTPVARKDVLPLMEVIFRLNGIGIVEEGGLYRIVPISDISKEPASVGFGRMPDKIDLDGKSLVQIVPVNYMKSSEMVRILTPFLSKNAVIVDIPDSNYIVIVDTDANVKRLVQLVGIFDSENLKRTKPQVFVYPVQNGKAKDVASLLQQIFLVAKTTTQTTTQAKTAQPKAPTPQQPQTAQQPASQTPYASGVTGGEAMVSENTRIIPDEITNTIVVLAAPEDYARMLETLREIDIVPRQVMIEAIVAEVKLTDNLRFGLQWLIQNDVKLQVKPFQNDINLNGPLEFISEIKGAALTYTALDLAGNTKLLIQALADDNKAKILSSPHILVSDNREARIQVGDQIPIATSTTTTPISGGAAATNTTTSTIQYKDTGTILKVKPQVNDSGLVALEISQEVSKANTISVLGTEQFIVTKREVSTNLVVQDGQTIVLGGLIDETTSKGRSGIPFLSKVPILGYLFGSTIDDTSRTELIILLTPRVIRNQKDAGDTSSDYLNRFRENTKIKIDEQTKVKSRKGEAGDESHKDSGQGGP